MMSAPVQLLLLLRMPRQLLMLIPFPLKLLRLLLIQLPFLQIIDISPSMEALPCSSSVFRIVVRQTPDLELKGQQFIQDMEREGLLVAVMQEEAIGPG